MTKEEIGVYEAYESEGFEALLQSSRENHENAVDFVDFFCLSQWLEWFQTMSVILLYISEYWLK